MTLTVEDDGLQALNSNPLVREELNLIPISQANLMIGGRVFPNYSMVASNVRYRKVDLGLARSLVLDTLRALDAKAKEIKTEFALAEIGVDEYMLKTLIDSLVIQEAGENGIAYTAQQLAVIRELMVIAREYRQAALALSPGLYDAQHKTIGYDLTDPTIYEDFMGFLDVVADVGRPANLMVFGRGAYRKAKNSATIKAQYTAPNGAVPRITSELLADFFEVDEVLVGRGVYINDAGVSVPFWDNAVWIGVVDDPGAPLSNMSFGRTATKTYANGAAFDTRQTDPQGVELLIEAGCAERYRMAVTNEDAAYLVTTL